MSRISFFFFSWKLNTEVDLLSGSMSLAILHSTDYSPLQRVPGIYFFLSFLFFVPVTFPYFFFGRVHECMSSQMAPHLSEVNYR